MTKKTQTIRLLLIVLYVLSTHISYAQCKLTTVISDGFEYATVIPDLIPNKTYGNTPTTNVGNQNPHSGNRFAYMNFIGPTPVNGHITLAGDTVYVRKINVCKNSPLQLSAWFKSLNGISNLCNMTLLITDGNNVLLDSTNTGNISSSVWRQYKTGLVTPTTNTVNFIVITTKKGENGNDLCFDDFLVEQCASSITLIPTSSSGVIGDSSLVEGCTDGSITINRFGNLKDTFVVKLKYATNPPTGTKATYGTDYTALPDSVVFYPQDTLIKLPVKAFQDFMAEGLEGFAINGIFKNSCSGVLDTIQSFMYIVNPSNVIASVNDVNICQGDSATLTATHTFGYGPFTYLWSTGDTTSSIKILPTKLITDVWVTIKSSCNGAKDTDSARVYITPNNPLKITALKNIKSVTENCGDTLYIKFKLDSISKIPFSVPLTFGGTANATNGLDYFTLGNQAFPDTVNFAIGDSVIIIPLIVLPDAVTEISEIIRIVPPTKVLCGTPATALSITIVDFKPIKASINNPSPLCAGKSTDFKVNALGTNQSKYTYSWIGGNASKTNIGSYTFNTNDSVSVVITDTLCGIAYDDTITLKVTVSPQLVVSEITSNKDSVLCAGDSVKLSVTATGGRTPITYSWVGANSTKNTALALPTASQTISVKVKDLCNTAGIIKNKDIKVPVYESLLASLTNDTTVDCPNISIDLKASVKGGAPFRTYFWNNTISNSLTYKTTPADTNGVYITFMVTDTCKNNTTDSTLVKLRTYGDTHIATNNDTLVCPGAKVSLTATVTRSKYNYPYTYSWKTVNSTNTITGPDSLQTYAISTDRNDSLYIFTVTDICDVSKSDTLIIRQKLDCTPGTYNVFTPEGDNINTGFQIKGIEDFPKNNVKVFNRWGKKVYEANDYSKNNFWDGKDVDAGTYYFIVTYEQTTNGVKTPEPLTGFVELIK